MNRASGCIVALTTHEANTLRACISGEIENDSPHNGDYFTTLRRVLGKIIDAQAPRNEA